VAIEKLEKLSRKPQNESTPGDAKKTATLLLIAQWLRLQLKPPHLNAAYNLKREAQPDTDTASTATWQRM